MSLLKHSHQWGEFGHEELQPSKIIKGTELDQRKSSIVQRNSRGDHGKRYQKKLKLHVVPETCPVSRRSGWGKRRTEHQRLVGKIQDTAQLEDYMQAAT